MKISNFEEEEIKPLSSEEHKPFENICYICEENVKDKIVAGKNSCRDKLKRIKTICQKHFTKLKKNEKHKIRNKTHKNRKTIWNKVLFWV